MLICLKTRSLHMPNSNIKFQSCHNRLCDQLQGLYPNLWIALLIAITLSGHSLLCWAKHKLIKRYSRSLMSMNIQVDFLSSASLLNWLRSCHEAVTTREWRLCRASCNCCVGTTFFCVLSLSSYSLSLLICIYFNNISKHHTTKQLCLGHPNGCQWV